jgi:hypothetical protein
VLVAFYFSSKLNFMLNVSEYLSGGGNWFNGTIPQEISMLSQLRELWMSTNHFSGPLPENIGNAQALGM